MERNGLNIMVFDDDESFVTQKSRTNHQQSEFRNSNSNISYSHKNIPNNSQAMVNNELKMLGQKLADLQQKTTRLHHSIKHTASVTNASEANISQNRHPNITSNINMPQLTELLRVIQSKIQIVIKQTKTIVERITNDFDKKIGQLSAQKGHQKNSIIKIQNRCQQVIANIQKHYKSQLQKTQKQHKNIQTQMISQVDQMVHQFKRKIVQLQNKQKVYLTSIQTLESKLRSAHKSKKAIQVTQDRKQTEKSRVTEKSSRIEPNRSFDTNGHPPPSANQSSVSVSKRRHRIFDGKSSHNSKSPRHKVHSPINNNNDVSKNSHSSKNIKAVPLSGTIEQKSMKSIPTQPQFHAQSQRFGPNVEQHPFTQGGSQGPKKPMVEVRYQNNIIRESQSSNFRKSNEPSSSYQPQSYRTSKMESQPTRKSRSKSKKNKPSDNVSEQFSKGAPKAQWENFQDFNDNQSDGSDQDVFFYPQNNSNQEPKVVFNYEDSCSDIKVSAKKQQQQGFFSPFDVN